MKSRRLNVSEDRRTISRRNTRSTTLLNGRGNSLPIPVDLVIEIFSWLPAKYIARCRCVSKLWAAILGRPDFTELFLTRSYARPQILFVFKNKDGVVFFSSQQSQNPVEHSADRLTHSPCSFEISRPSNGFVFLRSSKGRQNRVIVSLLFNPSTGQSITLPKVKTRSRTFTCMGYDPIEKLFKVLSITMSVEGDNEKFDEYQILTLGIGKPSWRMIECCLPHVPSFGGICINGVFYYLARLNRSSNESMIVCFDSTSYKFSFLNLSAPMLRATFLINYNGKLGSLIFPYFCGTRRSFDLWVLEDFGKNEWSKHVYVFPPVLQNVVADTGGLNFVGVVGIHELVFVPIMPYDPFYVFYYNIEKATVVRVGVHGMEAFQVLHTEKARDT